MHAGGRGASGRHRKGVAAASVRKRKERRSGGSARTERRPRVSTNEGLVGASGSARQIATGPCARLVGRTRIKDGR
jgi:hypothetical protein